MEKIQHMQNTEHLQEKDDNDKGIFKTKEETFTNAGHFCVHRMSPQV